MKRKMKSLWYLFLPMLLLTACYPEPNDLDVAEEQLVSITNVQTDFNFGTLSTFAVSDSLVILSNDGSKTAITEQTPLFNTIKDRIEKDLTAKGFTEVDLRTGNPDFVIGLSALKVVNITTYYPGWWWDYWDYYYPWWSGYYPYYPLPYYPSYTTAYSTGTLIMEMYDLKHKDVAAEKIPVRWLGLVRGLLDVNHSTSDIVTAIDDCFNQTPQLKK